MSAVPLTIAIFFRWWRRFVINGIFFINAWVAAEWLKRGMKEPPVQMAEILVHIVMPFTSGQTA